MQLNNPGTGLADIFVNRLKNHEKGRNEGTKERKRVGKRSTKKNTYTPPVTCLRHKAIQASKVSACANVPELSEHLRGGCRKRKRDESSIIVVLEERCCTQKARPFISENSVDDLRTYIQVGPGPKVSRQLGALLDMPRGNVIEGKASLSRWE